MEFLLKLQNFLTNAEKSIATILKVLILSKFRSEIKAAQREKEALIIGNGPSFKEILENHFNWLKNKELFCVNDFGKTKFYEKLRPESYVICDALYWRDDANAAAMASRKELFTALKDKTHWKLRFYCPFEAKKYKKWREELVRNEHIEIVYYNNTPVEGWDWFKFLFFRRNLGMPRPHNVLLPSIFLALNLGYKTLYLCGADHSWLPLITVTSDNRVLMKQKHFYSDNEPAGAPFLKNGKEESRLHDVLMTFYIMFSGYFELKRYADFRDGRVINLTTDSFIDAFEKLSLHKH